MRNNKERTVMNQANQKAYQYSIRKFTVGAASIAVGAVIFLGGGQAQAAEQEAPVSNAAAPTTVTDSDTSTTPNATPVSAPKTVESKEKEAPQTEKATPSNQVSVQEAIKNPSLQDPHANEERYPVEFKVVKPNTDQEAFFHASNIKQPAQFIKGDKASTVELTLDIPTIWDRFDVYQENHKLNTQVTAYDEKAGTAKLQFAVPNNTQSVIVKSSTKSSSRLVTSQEFGDVELKFNQPINASDSKPLTQDEYKKKKETEAFDNAITLEDKIYQLKKLMAKDKVPSENDKEMLADYEEQLKEQLEAAKKEFKNAPLSDFKITNPENHNFEVLHSKKNEPSHMDFEVVKPMQVFQQNGKHYVAMTIKSESMWDDFMVDTKEGYERVKTIARDTNKNERTVVFPYQVGIDHYDAIVKVSLPKINYEGAYHVRIKDLDQNKPPTAQSNQQSDAAAPKVTPKPQVEKSAPKPQVEQLSNHTTPKVETLNAAPVSKEIGFMVKKDGEDQKSVMDDYMDHPAKVVKENGKTFVQFTIKNPDWWQSFELFDGAQQLKQHEVSKSADQKVINFEVKPGTKMLTSKVHIVVPGINYNNKYTTQIAFDEAVADLKAPESKPQVKPIPKPQEKAEDKATDKVVDKTAEKEKVQPKVITPEKDTKQVDKSTDKASVESNVKPEIKVEPMSVQKTEPKVSEDVTEVQDATAIQPSMKAMPSSVQPLGSVKAKAAKSETVKSVKGNKSTPAKAKALPKTGTEESATTFGILSVFLGGIALFWNRHVKSKKNSL
ncbi:NEAT domain-containing protein [Staphylococcus simulans]|uniref:NEAT domain-containing protein n=1 Tax=Staphylococcus simulans TaxID=1286 RepID=UPI001304B8EB|nr:NEAT domain-containing protein [Staphylococcus simulans]MDY5059165.1 NEAT domain-containing protein [Staphylococcus simulans]